MILNEVSIKERNLIRNGRDESYRVASYDLTVGAIVTPDGTVVDEHPLKPQGMVKVISAESVDLPPNVTGYVHVKTSLCNEGILALNIGIVDPCFSGPLQSTLINFGKAIHRVKIGSVFGRVTFHEQMPPKGEVKKNERSIESVTDEAKSHVDRFLPKDFLDFSKTVKEAAKEATGEYRNTLLWYAPVLALLLAIFTYLLNFANMSRMESYINVKDRATELRQWDEMAAKFAELEEDRDGLHAEMTRLKQQVSSVADRPRP